MRGRIALVLGGIIVLHEGTRPVPSGFYMLIGIALLFYATYRFIVMDVEPPQSDVPTFGPVNFRPLPELERDMALDKLSDMWRAGMIADETYWGTVDDVLSRWEAETSQKA